MTLQTLLSSAFMTLTKHATRCVHDLAPLQPSLGGEFLTHTQLHVPAVMVAYKLFKNGVDCFDQLWSTNATVRKEMRVSMNKLTFLLDAINLKPHAILNAMQVGSCLLFAREFKRRIDEALVRPLIELQDRLTTLRKVTNSRSSNTNSKAGDAHLLLRNEENKKSQCYLWKITNAIGNGRYFVYSCTACEHRFHVNCFTFFHNLRLLQTTRPNLCEEIISTESY